MAHGIWACGCLLCCWGRKYLIHLCFLFCAPRRPCVITHTSPPDWPSVPMQGALCENHSNCQLTLGSRTAYDYEYDSLCERRKVQGPNCDRVGTFLRNPNSQTMPAQFSGNTLVSCLLLCTTSTLCTMLDLARTQASQSLHIRPICSRRRSPLLHKTNNFFCPPPSPLQ